VHTVRLTAGIQRACELRQERLHGNTFRVGSGTLVETLGEKRTKGGATRERELYKAAAAQGLHGDGWGRAGTALQGERQGVLRYAVHARAPPPLDGGETSSRPLDGEEGAEHVKGARRPRGADLDAQRADLDARDCAARVAELQQAAACPPAAQPPAAQPPAARRQQHRGRLVRARVGRQPAPGRRPPRPEAGGSSTTRATRRRRRRRTRPARGRGGKRSRRPRRQAWGA